MDDPQLLVDAKEKIRQSIDTILVPQGAEYEAVCRGLRGKVPHLPTVRAIPMAYRPLKAHLANWLASDDFQQCPASGVLLLGLAGSLSPKYSVGELVIYQKCLKLTLLVAQKAFTQAICLSAQGLIRLWVLIYRA